MSSSLSSSEVHLEATELEPDNIRRQKKDLRKQVRAQMKMLSAQDISEQSTQVWQRVIELPAYENAKTVGLFLSMPTGEINTDEILKHCVQQGKTIYVPEVGPNFECPDMELRKVVLPTTSVDDGDTDSDLLFHKVWPKNKWSIPEPPADMPVMVAKPGEIDILIVPGLAFDRSRNRLGQGKGYYDRFIAKMMAKNDDDHPLPLVAVALTPQLVEGTIPVASYDQKMDMVVLPDQIIT